MHHPAKTLLLVLSIVPLTAVAQGYGTVEEIVVTAAPTEDRVTPPSLVLDHDALQEFQPIATADVFRNVTGISLRTNSRGESVIRIRGAEERQTLVFLDGAPLATPWDGRADLALLPAGLIDSLEVKRGVVPIEYGANAVAGAVDLFTFVPDSGTTIRAEAQQGTMGTNNINALAGVGIDNGWSFVAGASSIERDAERIADRSSVAFDPSQNSERTNTDLTGRSLYLATGYSAKSYFLRASLLHADVERGVAAKGNLDPSVANPRFWRVPDWHLTQATLNGSWQISERTDLRVTAWRQWFDQTIDAYTDYTYATLDEREEGEDDTVGARMSLSYEFDRATVRLVSTAQESTHDQIESATATGRADDLVATPELRFRQRLLTIGAEADVPISDTLTTTFGLARDRAETPLTGDKPPQPSLSATGWSAGMRWAPAETWTLAATIGERTRFPTPRELYGASLGKFLLNPDLKPERSLLSDVNLKVLPTDSLSLDIAVWANQSDDTLSQRNVQDNGVSKRQRYNTNGSFTYGVEAAATYYWTDNFRTEFSAALQDGEVERDEDGDRPVLLQRPDAQVLLALDWQANPRLDLRAEFMHTGESFDLDDDGVLVTLPESNTLNLRGFFQIAEWRGRDIQVTASIDNLTDELVLPQLGLPAPGRLYRLGVRFN